ncbi:MAG TPA: hypothetical protein VLE73_04395 [Candidatus Saccharimonadales bacterium]|nr:hypothetical protein [Candidatus Saccharimonadales bacterium]
MELHKEYWPDVQQYCATILDGIQAKRQWVLWPVARTVCIKYSWRADQPTPPHDEQLGLYKDQLLLLGWTTLTHELTIPDYPYPRVMRFNPDEERVYDALPWKGWHAPRGWRQLGQEHYDLMYDALARGAAARQQERQGGSAL